jgi:hypothetical protein
VTVFDLHQHLWPDTFVAALRARTAPPCIDGDVLTTIEGRFPVDLREHDVARRLEMLDRDDVDVAVISLQTSLGFEHIPDGERETLEEAWAEGAREVVREGDGRILAFSPSSAREDFVGVSIGSSVLATLDATAPVLDEAQQSGALVFVHPDAGRAGAPGRPEWWDWVTGYPARMQEAYLAWLAFGRERWPDLRVLFAMLAGGGPFQLERLARRGVDVRSALDPNTFFDVSTHGRRAIELCIETFGVSQLAYGSDTPVVDPGPTLDAVRGFGDAVMHVLQSDTPSRLLSWRSPS